jgi:DNA-binding NarL/FixJ family response regulator
MVEALKQSANGVSIILDPMKFRRAGLASVLAQWAAENSVHLEQRSPDDPDLHSFTDLRMAILNLGGASVAEKESQAAIDNLHDLAPQIRIAIISDREATNEVVAAFKSGAHGYIPTSTEPTVALQALSFVLAGGSFFPPTVLLNKPHHHSAQRAAPRRDKDAPLSPSKIFTPSQLRVMAQLKDGKSNKLIARNLRLCEATVKLHVRQIMRKLGASNRTQVAIYCSTDGDVEEILRASEQTRAVIEDQTGKYENDLLNGATPPKSASPNSDGRGPNDSHSE